MDNNEDQNVDNVQNQPNSSATSTDLEFNIKVLKDGLRKQAIAEYGQIYRETRSIDKDKHCFNEILDQLQSSIKKENICLSKFGVNELLSMDAKNIALASELTVDLVKKFEVIGKFNLKDYLKKLKQNIIENIFKSNMGEIDPNKRLQLIHLYPTGKLYRNYHYSAPSIPKFFKKNYESNETAVKERRSTQRKTLPSGESTKPTQCDSSNMNNVDESDKRLEYIYKSLKKLERRNGQVPIFQAIINPNDFGLSVENIFNVAFLAKQSRIIIDSIEDEVEPIIMTKEPDDEIEEDTANETDNQKQSVQSIFSFDMDTYEQLVKNIEIDRPAFK